MSNFYNEKELLTFGFKSLGYNVLISRKCSIYSPEKISIGNNVRIDDFSILSGDILIGNYVHIAAFSALFAGDAGIHMYDFSGLSSRVTIYATSDDYSGNSLTNPTIPIEYRDIYKKKVIINKHAIIGASVVILPGVNIGEGCAVGSCSLVLKDCPCWTISAGIPCKVIKEREKKVLEIESKLTNICNINNLVK